MLVRKYFVFIIAKNTLLNIYLKKVAVNYSEILAVLIFSFFRLRHNVGNIDPNQIIQEKKQQNRGKIRLLKYIN